MYNIHHNHDAQLFFYLFGCGFKDSKLNFKCAFILFWDLQLGNMNMQNQNNHSFMNNGKNNANMVQMSNMAPLNGMNYNNASRQYLNPQNQQVFILVAA